MPDVARLFFVALLFAGLTGCGGPLPFSALDQSERDLLAAARQKAFEANKTGEGTNWNSVSTGNRGTVTPTRTYKSADGADCREFQQTATVAGETDIAYGTACRDPDGSWRIVVGPTRRYDTDVHGRFGYGRGFGHWDDFDYWHYPYRYRRHLRH